MGVPMGDEVLKAKAIERQWREYAEIYLRNPKIAETPLVLKELNGWLADKSFLEGSSPSKADRLIFDLLFEQMSSLSYSEKEVLIHLSRWYNTLQMSQPLPKRQISFSRSLLYQQ